MSKVFGALMEPFHRVVGGWYRRQVEKELIKYGLRYDDLLDPNMNLDVKEALNRLPQSEIDLRNQRIKRAIDISQKHTELPDEFKKLQTPFKHYLKVSGRIMRERTIPFPSIPCLPLLLATLQVRHFNTQP
mmetsp:Transcript_7871/g.19376  ORF Transcript_7871/g.19376 Transcript_7871/m.19376 type:complete len:131 (+) Transcript_7871:85-477(+)